MSHGHQHSWLCMSTPNITAQSKMFEILYYGRFPLASHLLQCFCDHLSLSRTRHAPPTAFPTPILEELSPVCLWCWRNKVLQSLEPEPSHSTGYSWLHLSILPWQLCFWSDRQHWDLSCFKIFHSNPSCKSSHWGKAQETFLFVLSHVHRSNFLGFAVSWVIVDRSPWAKGHTLCKPACATLCPLRLDLKASGCSVGGGLWDGLFVRPGFFLKNYLSAPNHHLFLLA